MAHPPLKRHPSLQPFSRDHYTGLVHAQRLMKSASGSEPDRLQALAGFASAWDEEIASHFDEEEQLLSPLMAPVHLERLRSEHTSLRSLAAQARQGSSAATPEFVLRLGTMLNDHIRWEERELFPAIERSAGPEALERIGLHTAPLERTRPRSRRR